MFAGLLRVLRVQQGGNVPAAALRPLVSGFSRSRMLPLAIYRSSDFRAASM